MRPDDLMKPDLVSEVVLMSVDEQSDADRRNFYTHCGRCGHASRLAAMSAGRHCGGEGDSCH
jgi:hypothetical protein